MTVAHHPRQDTLRGEKLSPPPYGGEAVVVFSESPLPPSGYSPLRGEKRGPPALRGTPHFQGEKCGPDLGSEIVGQYRDRVF